MPYNCLSSRSLSLAFSSCAEHPWVTGKRMQEKGYRVEGTLRSFCIFDKIVADQDMSCLLRFYNNCKTPIIFCVPILKPS